MSIRFRKDRIVYTIFYLIYLLPFMEIITFKYTVELCRFQFINEMMNYYLVVMCLGSVFIVFLKKYDIKSNYVAIMIMISWGYLITNTIVKTGSADKRLIATICVLAVLSASINTVEQFVPILYALNIFCVVNAINVFLHIVTRGYTFLSPERHRIIEGYYLFGYDNGFFVFLLPTLCFDLLFYVAYKEKKYLVGVLIPIVTVIAVFSASSIIGMLAVAIVYLGWKKLVRVFESRILIGCICIILVIAYSVIMSRQTYVNDLLFLVFGKTIYMARYDLWEHSLNLIRDKFLFGYGYRNIVISNGYRDTHNFLLDWLIHGGIIGLLLFVSMLAISFNEINKKQDCYKRVYFSCIIGFFVASLAESYMAYINYWCFLLILIIGSKIDLDGERLN